jgi:hypothetical protein
MNIIRYTLLAGIIGLSGCSRPEHEREKRVDWIGHPVVSDNRTPPSTGWIGSHQLGLREDGVVVWRQVQQPPTVNLMPKTPTPVAASGNPAPSTNKP